MQARMKNPGVVIPDAMTAIRALNEAIKQGGVPGPAEQRRWPRRHPPDPIPGRSRSPQVPGYAVASDTGLVRFTWH